MYCNRLFCLPSWSQIFFPWCWGQSLAGCVPLCLTWSDNDKNLHSGYFKTKKTYTVVAFVISLLLSACTTQQMHGSLQNAARDNCNKLLSETDRSACLTRNQGDYDT